MVNVRLRVLASKRLHEWFKDHLWGVIYITDKPLVNEKRRCRDG